MFVKRDNRSTKSGNFVAFRELKTQKKTAHKHACFDFTMNRNFVIERNVKRRRRVIPVSMNCQLVVSQSPSMTVTVNV